MFLIENGEFVLGIEEEGCNIVAVGVGSLKRSAYSFVLELWTEFGGVVVEDRIQVSVV